MIFQPLAWSDLTAKDLKWFRPSGPFKKADFPQMTRMLRKGEWKLWRLPEVAEGLAVTYPQDDLLFIYYLHGKGLFGKLTSSDLYAVAESEGLNGIGCEVWSYGTYRLMRSLGFKVKNHEQDPLWWEMELRRG